MKRPRLRIATQGSYFVLMTAFLIGCCDDNGLKTPTLEEAWQYFSAGNYTEAEATFRAVLASNTGLTNECHNGLGWSFAFDGELDSAQFYFEAVLGRDSTHVDAHAGLSAVLLAAGDLGGAITHATSVLELESDWSFTHYGGVDQQDIHLILAEAYFGQGELKYALAQAELDLLVPDNGLSDDDPATWNGHPTYAAALLKEIENLEMHIGAEMML